MFDDVSSTGKRILFWMSPTFLAAINNRSVRILFIDGTFKTTPKFFTQTWIIIKLNSSLHVKVGVAIM